jgi:hypothetical protein
MSFYTYLPGEGTHSLSKEHVQALKELDITLLGVGGKLDEESTRNVCALLGSSGYRFGSIDSIYILASGRQFVAWSVVEWWADHLGASPNEAVSAFHSIGLIVKVYKRPSNKYICTHVGPLEDVINIVPHNERSTLVAAAGDSWANPVSGFYTTKNEQHFWTVTSAIPEGLKG